MVAAAVVPEVAPAAVVPEAVPAVEETPAPAVDATPEGTDQTAETTEEHHHDEITTTTTTFTMETTTYPVGYEPHEDDTVTAPAEQPVTPVALPTPSPTGVGSAQPVLSAAPTGVLPPQPPPPAPGSIQHPNSELNGPVTLQFLKGDDGNLYQSAGPGMNNQMNNPPALPQSQPIQPQ